MTCCRRFVLVALLVLGPPAVAAELGSADEPLSVEVHAFVSQGYIRSTANNYLVNSRLGSFEFTEVGINFTKALTDRLRLGIQLFARDLGPIGDYTAKLDWFYLDYRWSDWLGFRAGRVKLPFGLYNEANDIDSARVPILLPQSVYPIQNRDFLLAQTGVELYGRFNLGWAGALEYRVYRGTIFLEVTPQPGNPITVLDLQVPYVGGARLFWETPLDGLRVGGSVQALRLDTRLLFPNNPTPADVQIPAVLWVASLEYATTHLLVSAEYSRWFVDVRSSDPTVFPQSSTVSERAYGMASWRVNTWFQPGVYYSLLYPNVDKRNGRENMEHDVAATLRFDISEGWLVKLEAHYLIGTAALSPALNGNQPLSTLTRDWGLFLAKTTAYF